VYKRQVQDSNDGNKGYIFTYECEKGNVSVGTWVDPDFLKGEKGDKGDVGERGEDGKDGQDGKDGIDGQRGEIGFRGATGEKGNKGDTGEAGTDGQDGQDGKQGEKGDEGKEGDKGEEGKEGKEGKKGEQGIQGRGLENPLELQYEGVIKSWKRVDLSVYYIHDFKNELDTLGVKVKHYWGKSWSEREIEKVNARLDVLENTPINYVEQDNVTVVPTTNGFRVEKGF